jgi:hypothetical protein
MTAFAVLRPYGTDAQGLPEYRVVAARRTLAALEKVKRQPSDVLVESADLWKPKQFVSWKHVKAYLNGAGPKRARAKKRPAAKRPAKRAARNAPYVPPPLGDWDTVLQALNAGGSVRSSETTAAVKAVRRLRAECGGQGAAKNPPAVLMSRNVLALYYIHAEDGKKYVHDFARGVSMYAVGDSIIELRRPDGRALSSEF